MPTFSNSSKQPDALDMSDNEDEDDAQIYCSQVRSSGDLGAVFEHDGDVGWFYLTAMGSPEGIRIIDTLHVMNAAPDLTEREVAVSWSDDETRVGVFIRGELWAVFNAVSGKKFGGGYEKEQRPQIPASEAFALLN